MRAAVWAFPVCCVLDGVLRGGNLDEEAVAEELLPLLLQKLRNETIVAIPTISIRSFQLRNLASTDFFEIKGTTNPDLRSPAWAGEDWGQSGTAAT